MDKILQNNILDNLNNNGFYENIFCPHCHSSNIVKNGRYKQKQRFICKNCNKNFNSLTNSPISMSHKPEKWPLFMECMLKGFSLRKSAETIGISYVTLFYWRHKLMNALKSIQKNPLAGDVEADDTFLAYSEKGNKEIIGRKAKKSGPKYCIGEDKKVFLLVVADHNNHLFIEASASRNSYVNLICESLGGIVSQNAVFCSNFKTFYKHFAKLKGIKQHYGISTYNRTEEHNIDLAHRYRKGVEAWLDKFQGVASKYLNNYLSLYTCLSKISFDKTEIGINNFIKSFMYVNIKQNYKNIKALKLA